MSFSEQERLLFDLMFDNAVQKSFSTDRERLFQHYQLSQQEQTDFKSLRYDALLMDVQMRRRLILAQMSKTFPVSFSLISSIPSGLQLIESLLNADLMRVAVSQRQSYFAQRMLEVLSRQLECNVMAEQESAALLAIIACEADLAHCAAELKSAIIKASFIESRHSFVDEEDKSWPQSALSLAPYVSVHLINQPYMQLKKKLCPKPGSLLWTHLQQHPLPEFLRQDALLHNDPRCIVSRATVTHASICDPVVDHLMVELSAGFSPLFRHVDGTNSVNDLLGHLRSVGAADALLTSVQSGFYQLQQAGMLMVPSAECRVPSAEC